MNKVTSLPSTNTIQEQASQWLALIDRGLSEQEKSELQLWAEVDAHRNILVSMAKLWDSMSTLSELSDLFPLEAQNPPAQKQRQYYSIAAAGFFCIIAIGLAALVPYFNSPKDSLPQRFSTLIGEQQQITLSDGSVMHLNTNSQVEVKFSRGQRDIYLNQGEAHFKVAHNKQRPFVVHAGEHKITAVGTAFNVQINPGAKQLEVLVTEGKVALSNEPMMPANQTAAPESTPVIATTRQLLQAGQKVAVTSVDPEPNQIAQSVTVNSAEMDSQLAWQRGFMIFSGEPLADVMKEVNRYSKQQFTVADNISQVEIAGYFKTDDIDTLLLSLQENFDIHIQRQNGSVQLLASPSSARSQAESTHPGQEGQL